MSPEECLAFKTTALFVSPRCPCDRDVLLERRPACAHHPGLRSMLVDFLHDQESSRLGNSSQLTDCMLGVWNMHQHAPTQHEIEMITRKRQIKNIFSTNHDPV